jgi:formate dehydrogenase subunit delta
MVACGAKNFHKVNFDLSAVWLGACMSSPDKLVYMANQIGKFFASQGEAGAVEGKSTHLKKFWDPRMPAKIIAHLEAGGAGLDPPVRAAVESLGKTKR